MFGLDRGMVFTVKPMMGGGEGGFVGLSVKGRGLARGADERWFRLGIMGRLRVMFKADDQA